MRNAVVDYKQNTVRRIEIPKPKPNGKTRLFGKNVQDYNSYMLGIKNYYQSAIHVTINFAEIVFRLSKILFHCLKLIGK